MLLVLAVERTGSRGESLPLSSVPQEPLALHIDLRYVGCEDYERL